MFNRIRPREAAFTLVEVSIVLVIIGLLVGGVLLGLDMMRAAEVRALVQQVEQYTAAFNTYKLKYGGYWPGDNPRASDFWSTAANGNGNGYLETVPESFAAWHQMSLANLINGNLNGVGTLTTDEVMDVNVPQSKLAGYHWRVSTQGGALPNNLGLFNPHGIVSMFMLQRISGVTFPYDAMTPKEAYGMDMKFDDGLPGYGRIIYYHSSCWTTRSAFTLSTASKVCNPYFVFEGKL